ncbi:hypothetical protein [uncultured Chitinophaga sp.]|uniref:hypothetical protein n=1 Tax=uncultured Chitinophaga sp. TaxID=339340 RepID=UPI0025E6FC99|nr:hypothetical protein [uncultured Chitinophaga sp.]
MQHSNRQQHKNAFIVWLAIYPLVTFMSFVLGDYLVALPLAAQTFISTAIAVPVVFYVLVPLLNKIFAGWLNRL